MKTARAMAIVIATLTALVLAGGCAAVTHPRVLGGGPIGFWSRSRPLLSQWCADRASVSPARRGGLIELRRRQSLERVRGFLVAEDARHAPLRDAPPAELG